MTAPINGRALAIASGIAATGGACALLLAEPLTTGHWSLDHGLTPLVVGLTVASGHLAVTALRARKLLAAVGFTAAFALGTAVTLLNGVGRQAATVADTAAAVTKTNEAVASKQAEIAKARTRYEQALQQADREMTGQRCGPRCTDWKTRASEVDSHLAILEVQLAKLGTTRVVNAKADKIGQLAAVLGFEAKRASHLVELVEPLLVPLLLELSAIVALGFGFAPRRRAVAPVAQPVAEQPRASATGDNPQPPKPGNRQPATRSVATKALAEAEVIRLVARGERLPSQDHLATRWGVHKGTVSKWCSDWETRGLIARQWDGRHNQIASARTGLRLTA